MAELIDLNINIGANTTDFQSSLTKAENLLKQFEAALKKATNVGEINYLNNQIKNLNTTISGIRTQMSSVAKPTADATNALSNLSRVAQDAPYGFIGIANNLNPLLESFQRLSKESGGSSNALKSMVSGLTGPAGIGIALATVSSIVVAFGDDISDLFNRLTGSSKSIQEFNNAFSGSKNAFSDAYIEIENLNNAFNDFHNGTLSKKDALDKYNNSLGKVYGTTKSIDEAEKIFIQNKDNYVKAALYRAAGQIALKKAAEEAFKQLEAQNAPQNANKGSLFMGEGIGAFALSKLTGAPAITATDIIGSNAIAKKAKDQENIFKGIFDQFGLLADEQDRLAARTKDFGKDLEKPSPIINYAREENKQLTLELAKMKALREKMKSIGLEPLKLFELPSEQIAKEYKRKGYFDKRAKDLLEESQKDGFGAYMQGLFKKDKNKLDEEEGERKRIEALTQSYYQFAQTISGTVTNALFSMYDAIQQGENPLQAIGQMFANIARQIAAVVVQALILQALMEAFPALKGAFAAVGLISDVAGKGKALSAVNSGIPASTSFNSSSVSGNNVATNGQFVLKGNDLVLALQRSNTTLNLMR